MKLNPSNLIPLCFMVLCGFCMAEERTKESSPEVEAEVEVIPEDTSAPAKVGGKTSAAKVSGYFDEIFGSLGQWLAHTFADDHAVESGNLLSSEVFMGGELSASGANQKFPLGEPFRNGGFVRPEAPPVVVNPPGDGPWLETESGKGRTIIGEGVRNEGYLPHSKSAIDRYFTTNVLRTKEKPAAASSRAEIQRTRKAVTTSAALRGSETGSASLALQAVPEPSSVLLFGFAAVVFTWQRRRAESR